MGEKKKRKRSVGKIDRLPPELKFTVEQMIASRQYYLKDIAGFLKENGHMVSLMCVQRFAEKYDASLEQIQVVQETFRALSDEVEKYPNMDTMEPILRIASHHALTALINSKDEQWKDKVNKDTHLGFYGNTGSLQGMAIHLHIEADTDTANPLASPTVKSSSLLKGTTLGANDKTMTNPLEWLYRKASAPDNQTYTTTADAYIRVEDKTISVADEPAQTSEIDRLREENGKLQQDNINLNAQISALESKLKQINQLSA